MTIHETYLERLAMVRRGIITRVMAIQYLSGYLQALCDVEHISKQTRSEMLNNFSRETIKE